jgi:type IV secretion system protein VirB7
MRRGFLILFVMSWPLGGCASFYSAPPTCDGLARRPLNRSLWDWEAGTALIGPQALAVLHPAPLHMAEASRPKAKAAANPASPPSPVAGEQTTATRGIDLASYRSCGKES